MTNDGTVAKSPKAERDAVKQAKQLIAISKEIIAEGVIPFELEGTKDAFEARTINLVSAKDAEEAELSFLLYTLRESRGYLDSGFASFPDYAEAKIGISRTKANALASSWGLFLKSGLPVTVLGGPKRMNWNKFRLLKPAIERDIINIDNIQQWLPLISVHQGMRDSDIETKVRRLLHTEEAETDSPNTLVMLKLGVPKGNLEALDNYRETVRLGTEIDDAGMQYLKAMELMASHIMGENLEAAKLGGLIGLKRAAESLVPGITCVFIASEDSGLTYDKLGVPPVHNVYQGYCDINGTRSLAHVLAASDEEAKKILNTEEVRKFPITLSDSVRHLSDCPPTSGQSDTEEQPKQSDPEGYQDFEMIDSKTLVKIMVNMASKLISRKIVTKEGYEAKYAELKTQVKTEKQLYIALATWLQAMCLDNRISPKGD